MRFAHNTPALCAGRFPKPEWFLNGSAKSQA
jgi:hypothetical protein